MNKFLPILALLVFFLIFSCSSYTRNSAKLVKIAHKATKKIKKIKKICKKECKENEKSSNEWCDCMSLCSNNKRIQDLVLKDHKGNLSINRNGDSLIIKEDGTFQIEFSECVDEANE